MTLYNTFIHTPPKSMFTKRRGTLWEPNPSANGTGPPPHRADTTRPQSVTNTLDWQWRCRLVAALCEPCTLQMSRFIIPHGRVHAFFRISSRAVHRRVPHDRFPHEGAWAPCGIENRVSIRAFFQEEMRKQIRRCSRQCTPDGGAAGEMRRDG